MKELVFFIITLAIDSMVCYDGPACNTGDDFDSSVLPDNQTFLLLSSYDNKYSELNEKFISLAESVGYIDIVKTLSSKESGVLDTICASQRFVNVINLHVTDFYKFNYGDIENNGLHYAGDIGEELEIEFCAINYNNTDDTITNCNVKHQKTRHVKLVSEAITESLTINDLVTKFPENEAIIIICYIKTNIFKYDPDYLKGFIRLKYEKCTHGIEKTNSNLIAVFTPKPLIDDLIPLSVPRFFYETPNLFNSNEDIYPYYLNSVPEWQPLAHAFLKFIKILHWTRIAVISDSAPSSEAFETQLIDLFENHKILYGVQHCMNKDCDFKEELTSLLKADARIIIVNIENKNYANKFLQSAKQLGMAKRPDIVWIIREWPFNNDFNYLTLKNAFTISLGVPETHIKLDNDDVADLQSIFMYAEKIANEFKSNTLMYKDFITDRNKFYRNLAQNIRTKVSNTTPVKVQVTKIGKTKDEILSMMVYHNGHIDMSFKPSFQHKNPMDFPKCPLAVGRAYFYKPCDDNEVVLIMIVTSGVLFGVLVLMIISDNYIEYLKKYSVSRERLVAQ